MLVITPRKAQRHTNQNKIIVIIGPTASGKSDLAIKLAKKYNGEIISADSRQVYRGMDIGTGKVKKDMPKAKGLRANAGNNSGFSLSTLDLKHYYSSGIRHHLIDVASPKTVFTADRYKRLGQKALKEILAKDKTPIIVGGTGFYIDVLLSRITLPEVPPNKKLRTQFDKLSVEELFKKLKKLDPERAKTIDPKNKRRLIRALEIAMSPKSKVQSLKSDIKYGVLWIGINIDQEKLNKKIKKRLDERLSPAFVTSYAQGYGRSKKTMAGNEGMIKEVKDLHKQGVSWKRMDELGLEYRYVSRWLTTYNKQPTTNNNFKKSEYYKILLREIIKYSKRQMTWFTQPHPWEKDSPKNIKWITSYKQAGEEVKKFLGRG